MQPSPIVIIADDDDVLVALIMRKLKGLGFVTHSSRDGNHALELIRDLRPDIAILDVMMPGVDGYQILKTMKADTSTSEIPVIILTSRNTEEDLVKSFGLGAVDYINKPVSPSELATRVMSHIGMQPRPELNLEG
jgi:DNA-binding response OmpR family regulator